MNQMQLPVSSPGPAAPEGPFAVHSYKILPCALGMLCATLKNGEEWRCTGWHYRGDRRRPPLVDGKYFYTINACGSQDLRSAVLTCPQGENCPQIHNSYERSYHPALYKTVSCKHQDKCWRGAYCSFAHTLQAQRAAQAAAAKLEEQQRILNNLSHGLHGIGSLQLSAAPIHLSGHQQQQQQQQQQAQLPSDQRQLNRHISALVAGLNDGGNPSISSFDFPSAMAQVLALDANANGHKKQASKEDFQRLRDDNNSSSTYEACKQIIAEKDDWPSLQAILLHTNTDLRFINYLMSASIALLCPRVSPVPGGMSLPVLAALHKRRKIFQGLVDLYGWESTLAPMAFICSQLESLWPGLWTTALEQQTATVQPTAQQLTALVASRSFF